ncbi:MAG: 4Fe-4S binding protein [Anaerolineae bacterium]|nr:4Fe-4S binding protein [Anaerolineae bacterium]
MPTSYRQVMVDGAPVGLRGLDEILVELRTGGRTPQDEGLGLEIVKRLGKDNYIPYGARDLYAAVFTREYAAYLARSDGDGRARQQGYGTWRGYPREQIPWYPTLIEDLCDGCGKCLKLCRTGALAATEDGIVHVVDLFACVVGCSSCATVCKPGAITFPARSVLDGFPLRSPRR